LQTVVGPGQSACAPGAYCIEQIGGRPVREPPIRYNRPAVDVNAFVRNWAASTLSERAASQSHFIDLCRVLGEPTPAESDPSGDFYTFERGAPKTGGGDGFADVWLKDHFGWEYKGKHRDLQAAYKQLLDYHESLGQPPLMMVCDFERYELHTKWTNTESWVYRWRNADLAGDDPVEVTTAGREPVADAPKMTALQVLKAMWEDPEKLKPGRTTEQITKEAAGQFQALAEQLRKYGDIDDHVIAHLVSQLVFCLFATDIGLLPKDSFSSLLRNMERQPEQFRASLADLFARMRDGGTFGAATIPHINGWLFAESEIPRLTTDDIRALQRLDAMNWAEVEPSIFGTLFERVLDRENKRAQLGAHYTSRADIELLVEPVLMQPLRREWEAVQSRVAAALDSADTHGASAATKAERVREQVAPLLERLAATRVLDPACGSGNFLYVSLALLKALEKEVIAFAGLYGARFEPRVHPRQLSGIEINPYAHELASVVIWIGYLQWKARNALPLDNEEPVLEKLEQVRLMDAILDLSDPASPREPAWPDADVIVGNPPFLGSRFLRRELGDHYVDMLFSAWDKRVNREADLCCYWFEKARALVAAGMVRRVGLLATQGIRGRANRETLQRVKSHGDIFFAEADRPWILEGAAVRISMIGFDDGVETQRYLDGRPVEGINANLTSASDLTTAKRLRENAAVCFQGAVVLGPFAISYAMAHEMIASPNPHGGSNLDVVRPYVRGADVAGRASRQWIVDFAGLPEAEAALYEAPFEYIRRWVKPTRDTNRRERRRTHWWQHGETISGIRERVMPLPRYAVTPRVAKHRVFSWLGGGAFPDSGLVVFARDDDYFFGVLHSRPHELWALRQGTQLRERESGFRYTPTTCFETFPFPWPPGKEPQDDPRVAAVTAAAKELDDLRNRWLNPAEDIGESGLRKRTLTNLYNERPAWLQNAHRKLDEAVFDAYGWPHGLADEEILARLLALNLERAGA